APPPPRGTGTRGRVGHRLARRRGPGRRGWPDRPPPSPRLRAGDGRRTLDRSRPAALRAGADERPRSGRGRRRPTRGAAGTPAARVRHGSRGEPPGPRRVSSPARGLWAAGRGARRGGGDLRHWGGALLAGAGGGRRPGGSADLALRDARASAGGGTRRRARGAAAGTRLDPAGAPLPPRAGDRVSTCVEARYVRAVARLARGAPRVREYGSRSRPLGAVGLSTSRRDSACPKTGRWVRRPRFSTL